jgi:hypothetical protein
MSTIFNFNAKDLALNNQNVKELEVFCMTLFHKEGDPPLTNRIILSNSIIQIEILPSKGFSVGQATIAKQNIFWEPPISIPNTEHIDLWSDEIHINGSPAPGFTFLKTFTGGIEMYGLRNWGMPQTINGQLFPLHGETSNIPVEKFSFYIDKNKCGILEASFIYRTFIGDSKLHWYNRGTSLFRVNKKIILPQNRLGFSLHDTIENISKQTLIPSWGYHITFHPEENAKILIPSSDYYNRNGNNDFYNFNVWNAASPKAERTETGIIYKNIIYNKENQVVSIVKYPNQKHLKLTTPYAPYFQSWFCCGGKGSKEFTDSNGNSIMEKNWDGMGIEIGSDALDHNTHFDEFAEKNRPLHPGEKKDIHIKIELKDPL